MWLRECQGLLQPALSAALAHAPCTAYYASQRLYAKRSRKASEKADNEAVEEVSSRASTSKVDDNISSSSSGVSTPTNGTKAAAAAAQALPASTTTSDSPQRLAALDSAMKQLNKKLGSGTIMRLGDHPVSAMECISSGCLTLDIALGGGWPRGRIVEIYGQESSGKSTLALHAIAEVQKAGGQALLVDAEHAFNREFARKLGVCLKVNICTGWERCPRNGRRYSSSNKSDSLCSQQQSVPMPVWTWESGACEASSCAFTNCALVDCCCNTRFSALIGVGVNMVTACCVQQPQ